MARGTLATGYTAADVAQILRLRVGRVQAYVRAGFVSPRLGPHRECRFSLQDLVLLRTVEGLTQRIPPRRVCRALRRLREQLGGQPLSGVRITVVGENVVVCDRRGLWEPESGQGSLDFEADRIARDVAPLARRELAPDAEDWYRTGSDLEPSDPEQARDAYRRALELDPGHVAARVNLGRSLHETGHAEAAAMHYRLALAADPEDATATFNLGVALEDLGRADEAIAAYERAVASDPENADAHVNAARLYERAGERAAAFRHLKACRRITRER